MPCALPRGPRLSSAPTGPASPSCPPPGGSIPRCVCTCALSAHLCIVHLVLVSLHMISTSAMCVSEITRALCVCVRVCMHGHTCILAVGGRPPAHYCPPDGLALSASLHLAARCAASTCPLILILDSAAKPQLTADRSQSCGAAQLINSGSGSEEKWMLHSMQQEG